MSPIRLLDVPEDKFLVLVVGFQIEPLHFALNNWVAKPSEIAWLQVNVSWDVVHAFLHLWVFWNTQHNWPSQPFDWLLCLLEDALDVKIRNLRVFTLFSARWHHARYLNILFSLTRHLQKVLAALVLFRFFHSLRNLLISILNRRLWLFLPQLILYHALQFVPKLLKLGTLIFFLLLHFCSIVDV